MSVFEFISFMVKIKVEEFVLIEDFFIKDEVIFSEELNKIIIDVIVKMYGGMDISGINY